MEKNTKHKYIRNVQIAYIIQLICITHGNCTDNTIVGTTTCKKNMSPWGTDKLTDHIFHIMI